MKSKRKILTAKIVLNGFNTSAHPLYFMGRVTMYENDKLKTFLNFQAGNPFEAQSRIKQVYPDVETRAYYPHTLLIKTR